MQAELIQYAKTLLEINLVEEDLIRNYFHVQEFKKKDIILHSNTMCENVYFVLSGITRNYYINEKAVEVTRKFGQKNDFVANYPSFNNQTLSNETIECLTDVTVLYVSYQDFYFLIKESHAFDTIFRMVLSNLLEYHVQRIEFLTSFNPKERLQIFKKDNPILYKNLTNKVIATFLSLSAETCSRLKKEI